MKNTLRSAFLCLLALLLAAAVLPVSALPSMETLGTAVEPSWTVPEGYNAHDYTKCVLFLEQTDANGVKNGEKLSENYDPNDPETWGSCWYEIDPLGDEYVECFQWATMNGELRINKIYANYGDLIGAVDAADCTALELLSCYVNGIIELDVSGCTALETLKCSRNSLTKLDVSSNTALEVLYCSYNALTKLDVSSNTALEVLNCGGNELTALDVSQNSALKYLFCSSNYLTELDVSSNIGLLALDCGYNSITELDVTRNTALAVLDCGHNSIFELDVSGNTALRDLYCETNGLRELDVSNNAALIGLKCTGNMLTELDISNSRNLPYDHIISDGMGHIGYYCDDDVAFYVYITAKPVNGADFEGFYDENGALVHEGVWREDINAYYYELEDDSPTGTVIARFSGGALPGDIDGSGSVSTADAITTLRLAMQLLDGNGMNTDAADMDGNGSITLADAILILRTAMGLA